MTRENVFAGSNVEEAISVGLATLGLDREAVDVEVLDEGSRGILGIGGRQAQVRLTPRSLEAEEELPPPSEPETELPAPEEPEPELPPPAEPETELPSPEEPEPELPPPLEPELPSPEEPESLPPEEAEVAEVARSVLGGILERMAFAAEIRTYKAEPASDEEESPLVVDVHGSGVDALIGHRGRTLAGLQRLVRIIVNRRMGRRANLVVDVAGYKQRRRENLRRLADRMGDKAAREGERVELEPMSAYERRIVHLALKDRPDVYTESVGSGRHRRVTIRPASS